LQPEKTDQWRNLHAEDTGFLLLHIQKISFSFYLSPSADCRLQCSIGAAQLLEQLLKAASSACQSCKTQFTTEATCLAPKFYAYRSPFFFASPIGTALPAELEPF